MDDYTDMPDQERYGAYLNLLTQWNEMRSAGTLVRELVVSAWDLNDFPQFDDPNDVRDLTIYVSPEVVRNPSEEIQNVPPMLDLEITYGAGNGALTATHTVAAVGSVFHVTRATTRGQLVGQLVDFPLAVNPVTANVRVSCSPGRPVQWSSGRSVLAEADGSGVFPGDWSGLVPLPKFTTDVNAVAPGPTGTPQTQNISMAFYDFAENVIAILPSAQFNTVPVEAVFVAVGSTDVENPIGSAEFNFRGFM